MNTALEFAITTETALAKFSVSRKAGIVTGTCWSGLGRLANAAGQVQLSDTPARRDRAMARLREAAAFVAAMLPLWGALGVEVNDIGKEVFDSLGQPRRAGSSSSPDLDTAKASAIDAVLKAGGASAVAMARVRASAEDGALAAAKEEVRAIAKNALAEAGSGAGPLPASMAAAEFERMWEAAQRQTAWAVEALERTRLPSRVAQLGAEAAEYALLAAEFEQLATAAYAAADAEAGAEVAATAAVFDLA